MSTLTNDLARLANNANVLATAITTNATAITSVNVAGVIINSSGIISNSGFTANGTLGVAGQVLTTNGSGTYWSSAGVNTNATYNWSNVHTFGANVTINGDLLVTGTTVTINTTTIDVKDKNITVAKGSTASASDGAGLTVDGSNIGWYYTYSTNNWTSNTGADFTGNLSANNLSANTLTTTGGTEASRPAGAFGLIRYNSNSGFVETYTATGWASFAINIIDYGTLTDPIQTSLDFGSVI